MPTDSGRVIHSFTDDGPSLLLFRAEGRIGDDGRGATDREGGHGRGRRAMRTRLLMAWPAAVLAVVVGIAATGGTGASQSVAPLASPVAVAPAPGASVAAAVAAAAPGAGSMAEPVSMSGAGAGAADAAATQGADPAGTSAAAAGTPWIAYTFGDRIRLVRADGSDDHVVLADIGLRQRGASWSPDGRLVFEADFGAASQLWVADEDGGNASPLTDIDLACTTACVFAGDAAWSGDGSAIAYVRRTVDHGITTTNELVVVDVGARTSRRLLADDRHGLRVPSWEPNGHRIVVERDGGPGALRGVVATATLVMVDARETQPTPARVPGTGTDARDPSWGGNGLIAYATTRVGDPADASTDGGSALVVVDPDSGLSLTLLAFREGASRVTSPAWWPNGHGLLYGRLAPHAVVPVVRTVNLDTRQELSATGGETAVGFDARMRRSAP